MVRIRNEMSWELLGYDYGEFVYVYLCDQRIDTLDHQELLNYDWCTIHMYDWRQFTRATYEAVKLNRVTDARA